MSMHMSCTDIRQASCNCLVLIVTTQIFLSTCKSVQPVNEYSQQCMQDMHSGPYYSHAANGRASVMEGLNGLRTGTIGFQMHHPSQTVKLVCMN